MRKYEKMQVSNEMFTCCTITKEDVTYNLYKIYGLGVSYDLLGDCYGTPSKSKETIYNYWIDYALSLENGLGYEVLDYGIETYNSRVFTFGIVARKDKDFYKFHIYPTHNDLLIIKDYYTE